MEISGIRYIKSISKVSNNLKFMLLCSLLIPLASFMVLPFMTIYLHELLHIDLTLVGLLLAIGSFIQYSGGMPGGILAYKIGLKRTMVIALTIRSLGFLLMAISFYFPSLVFPGFILVTIGAATYLPANKAFIVNESTKEQKALFLSLSRSALNAGMALGPIIGGFFLTKYPLVVFSITTSLFVFLTMAHLLLLLEKEKTEQKKISFRIERAAFKPIVFNIITYYIYMFFQNYLGLYMVQNHSIEIYSLILLFLSITIIVLQPLLADKIQKLSYNIALLTSFLLFSVGMILIAQAGLYFIILGALIVTLGEIIILLKNELEILSVYSQPELSFGMHRFTAGVGTFMSAMVGAQIFKYLKSNSEVRFFWIVTSGQSLIIAVFVVILLLFYMFNRQAYKG